jgi:hypothetical protein
MKTAPRARGATSAHSDFLRLWLGRLDSNQGMAESKSNDFRSKINTHSETLWESTLFYISGLGRASEREA